MSQFRPVALLFVAGVGCYNEAPAQSTLPQLQYVSGPPGGNMDPGDGYGAYANDPGNQVAEPIADNAPAPSKVEPTGATPGLAAPAPGSTASALAPAPAEPAEPAEDNDQDLAEASPAPDAPADPTAGVTDAEIDATLDGYGQWIDTDDYGEVWRPDATVVGVDFTPYESGGSWEYTDAGWAFACDYGWGWLPFHYGRWAWFHDYWAWVPGYRWAPAWVEWRHGGGVVGWRPLAPTIRDHRHGVPDGRDYHHGSGPLVRDHRHPEQHDSHWRFATVPDFARPHVRSHLYGNLAEGLRVTGAVTAPPLRARTAVHAGDLMRSRFTAGGPLTRPGPGRSGRLPQVRDHRSSDPVQAYHPPVQGERPARYQPYNPPARAYPGPEAYRPPVRTQPYNPAVRTYEPPVRSYQPPARTYQPPASSPPPVRTVMPPTRTSTPHAPSSPPSRSWSPPPSADRSHGPHSSPPSNSGSHSGGGGSHASSSGSSHSSRGGGHHR